MIRLGWAVFVDRDGTLVPDVPHATRPDQLRLYARAGHGLRRLSEAKAKLAVISNQSAVARGLLTPAGLRAMDRRLRALTAAEGARLDGTYYCPHHPDFTGRCRCRKPAPGLLRDAMADLGLAPRDCFFVGDTASDMTAGRAAKVTTVLVLTGHGGKYRREVERARSADHVARDLAAAAAWIVKQREA